MLFAEIGDRPDNDLFLRIEYDGSIATNGATLAEARQDFGVCSGTRTSSELMESYLKREHKLEAPLPDAVRTALYAWTLGCIALDESGPREIPSEEILAGEVQKQLAERVIEAAVLERTAKSAIRYRPLNDNETKTAVPA
jgi:hypothetical protein